MMLRSESQGEVRILTLARPERRNALSLELMRELLREITVIAADTRARAVILAAEGPVFSSGHDLNELAGRAEADYREIFQVCTELMVKLHEIPTPVIAEVQGVATAAGCQLVAACDLAVASEGAKFATPGVRIGLFCTTPMVPLVRAVGRKRAMEMLMTGETIDAQTALEWGLVNRVVPAAELRSSSLSLAHKICEASACTVAIGKRAFYEQVDCPEQAAYGFACETMTANSLAADAQEGISAFLEKRTPNWVSERGAAAGFESKNRSVKNRNRC